MIYSNIPALKKSDEYIKFECESAGLIPQQIPPTFQTFIKDYHKKPKSGNNNLLIIIIVVIIIILIFSVIFFL